MSIHYDVTTDIRYQQGETYGITIGEAKGKAEGLHLTAKIIKLYTRGFDAVAIAEKLLTEITIVNTAIATYEAE
jgi:hypothetical protein